MSAGKTFLRSTAVVILILLAVLIVVITMRLSYAFQIFSFDSDANIPTIQPKTIVFSSDLKKPSRFNYIVFHRDSIGGTGVWMLRLCGLPGDSVEIRNGSLLVNNQMVDSMFTLSHSYVVNVADTPSLHIRNANIIPADSNSVMITLPDTPINSYPQTFHRYIVPDQRIDSYIQKQYDQPWNADNFGPVMVPAGHYFVMGDNRSNAMDSRYLGFIPVKDFRGTVLNY